jgi:hypothetical protein
VTREKNLNQFPEEMWQAWDLAKRGQLRLEFPTKGGAQALRHRMYGFRTALRREGGVAGAQYNGVELVIREEPSSWVLTTGQADWKRQLADQLATVNRE